jgi:hypothetical protein
VPRPPPVEPGPQGGLVEDADVIGVGDSAWLRGPGHGGGPTGAPRAGQKLAPGLWRALRTVDGYLAQDVGVDAGVPDGRSAS